MTPADAETAVLAAYAMTICGLSAVGGGWTEQRSVELRAGQAGMAGVMRRPGREQALNSLVSVIPACAIISSAHRLVGHPGALC
jgi:hypothetical protein